MDYDPAAAAPHEQESWRWSHDVGQRGYTHLKILKPASSPMMAATLYASEYFSNSTDMSMKDVALTENVDCKNPQRMLIVH
jgi:hypothetical protein